MLKRDPKAKFEHREEAIFEKRKRLGGLFYDNVHVGERKYWILRSGYHGICQLEDKDYQTLLVLQKSSPVLLWNDPSNKRHWWMFMDEFYWEDDGYTENEVKALILDRVEQKERKIKQAVERLDKAESVENNPPLPPLLPLPDPIPNHVKLPARQEGVRIWKWKTIEEWNNEISRNGIDSAATSRWYRFREDLDKYYLFRFRPIIGPDQYGEPYDYFEVKNLLETEVALYPQLRALIDAKIAILEEAVANSDKYPLCIPYIWSPSDDDTRSAWFFKKEIYVVEHPSRSRKYTDDQIRQLILEFGGEETNRRERIPEHVRVEVWRRDGGKCVKCGSREKLEYDHIVPVSRGGSNTARNIELLCETCNRKKSNHIE